MIWHIWGNYQSEKLSEIKPPLLEEGSEHNNKIVRYNREHHARQFSLQLGLLDAFHRDCNGSDPRILRIIEQSINKNPPELHLSQSVIALLEETDDSNISEMSDDSSDSEFFVQPWEIDWNSSILKFEFPSPTMYSVYIYVYNCYCDFCDQVINLIWIFFRLKYTSFQE